ncbi:PucR family transcriptional regulator [Desulfofundulus thermosubterraneus]|uniref:Purine catabolism regulatory protein n=1 Tax=Desulfofundulus thermosubterraneus DSM 16057 TaxID=1121432 RepID=A0A1M6A6V0_9FIRM|nr:PucR family transcriptional regulator [Desulfofundulus thermosubterraneus]SHI32137.1 purine catabolism regulatory protein [Desulfofundulus thermosubterraneus DSM 16057]
MKGITVNEALELLKGHGVILKAGRNGLSRIIETVSVLEVTRYQDWVRGGELFLTTLGAFPAREQVYDLIRDLSRAGVTALAVHPGHNLEVAMDDCAFQLAEELNFPVLVLPRSIPYSTVFSVVMGAILNKQKMLLEKSLQINTYLTDILLAGGSFEKIALSLQKLINRPVMITDSSLKVLAVAGTDKVLAGDFTREALDVLRQLHSSIPADDGFPLEGSLGIRTYNRPTSIPNVQLLLTRVAVGRELYGYVVTPAGTGRDGEFDISDVALTHAATAVALEESKRRAIKRAEDKMNIEFWEDLLYNHYDSEEIIIQRAQHLGFELNGKRAVMIVAIDRFEDYYLEGGEILFQELKNQLCRIVRVSALSRNQKNIVIPKSDGMIVLMHIAREVKPESIKSMLFHLAQEITAEVNRMLGKVTVSIGIGRCCDRLTGVAQSYHEAEQALKIGRRVQGGNGIFDFEQLGIYALLLSFGNNEVKESCRQRLAKLLEYDSANKAELIKTMEVYLDYNENISRTAEKLYIHPNSVKYRLERIKEILGKDPFCNGEEKLYYYLSLKALKVL